MKIWSRNPNFPAFLTLKSKFCQHFPCISMPFSPKISTKKGRIPKFRLASRGSPENFLWEIFLQLFRGSCFGSSIGNKSGSPSSSLILVHSSSVISCFVGFFLATPRRIHWTHVMAVVSLIFLSSSVDFSFSGPCVNLERLSTLYVWLYKSYVR